ncbi:homocysteine S-methyltransferase family protein [Candidatus Rhodobacter oscarellae]|uniref:homocysteine S-methyltransferase family protein n=1 Tax=Candidatus Rhodobacter oscarellae TaxID=1675527 RepID=UPI001F18844B|nr:homocysteine S-methyltransferase family protein [Candidatus Rhodobacter lobularis]
MQPILIEQMRDLIEVAEAAGMGAIIDTLTWMANRDRAAPLGYDADRLVALNRQAVGLMLQLRQEKAASSVLVALCVGPSRDAYAKLEPMSVKDARSYHRAQIGAVADMGIDLVNAYTFNQVEEAAGAVLAARDFDLPVALSLVVETDGRLNNGEELNAAIDRIDALTDGAAAYFMINCAHPSHFADVLTGHPRLRGIVVNASRRSHAELDNADALDAGNPEELAGEVADLVRTYPELRVIGGCCGTDMRHLKLMAERVMS